MIEMLLLVAASVATAPEPEAPPVIVERRAVPTAHLDIPDEIAPAVVPYMGCLLARDGVEIRGSFDPRPEGVGRGADCSSYRDEAARRADIMLQRLGGRSPDERRTFIEQTLISVEKFPRPGAAPSPPPGRAELGRKLATGKFHTSTDENGKLLECKVTKSTGDAELDRSFCDIASACSAENSGNMKAIYACMDLRQEKFLHELALRRATENPSGEEKNTSVENR